MRIVVDEALCCGSGQCVVAAPEVFDQRDDDAVVVLLIESPTPDQVPGVRRAAAVCPVAAIVLHDDED